MNFAPADEGRLINDQPDLDLVYYQPYIPKDVQRNLFEFLRRELPFYRVKYTSILFTKAIGKNEKDSCYIEQ